MRKLWFLCAMLVLGGAAHARPADCLLIVNGLKKIDGICDFRIDPTGFQITSINGPLIFAQIDKYDQSEVLGYWNEAPGSNHAHSSLGNFRQDGACWVSNIARICAWKIGESRTWQGKVKAPTSPPYIRPGEDYGVARSQLLLQNLSPITTGFNCKPEDIRCKSRPEVAMCSGTGLAHCRFRWGGAEGLIFDVVTTGEETTTVKGVECVERCATKQRTPEQPDDAFPIADVEADCSRQGAGNNVAFNSCLQLNQSAYNDVKAVWDRVPTIARVACKSKFGLRQPHYYAIMRTCLVVEAEKVDIEAMKGTRGKFRY